MNTLELLKAAKQYLANTGEENKTTYICFAVDDAVYASHNTVNWKSYHHVYREAKRLINNRLEQLNLKLGELLRPHFTVECAAYLLNIPASEVGADSKQKARHVFLDSLIAELEAEQAEQNTDKQ